MKKVIPVFIFIIFSACTTPSRLGIRGYMPDFGDKKENNNITVNVNSLTEKDHYENLATVKRRIVSSLENNNTLNEIIKRYPDTKVQIDILPTETKNRTWLLDALFFYPCSGYWPFSPWWGEAQLSTQISLKIPNISTNNYNLYSKQDYTILFYPYYKAGSVITDTYSKAYADLNNKLANFEFEKDNYIVKQDIIRPINNLANNNINNSKVETIVNSYNLQQVELPEDVDISIPSTRISNTNTFALIIGNEDYNKEIKVNFAKNDAQIFSEYCKKTLGLPEKNVHLLLNGTYGQLLDEITWINGIAKAFNGKARLIFYYAGHGMPDKSHSAFLLPVDGNSTNTATAVKLEYLYAQLTEHPTLSTSVFLDACFSGDSRDGMIASGRGVKVMAKTDIVPGNMVILSACTGDETAYPYKEKQHGLFSYYLLKKLQETKGDASLAEISEYIQQNVRQQSAIDGKIQNPQTNYSSSLGAGWKNLKLK